MDEFKGDLHFTIYAGLPTRATLGGLINSLTYSRRIQEARLLMLFLPFASMPLPNELLTIDHTFLIQFMPQKGMLPILHSLRWLPGRYL